MDYFKEQLRLLRLEKEEDRRSYEESTRNLPISVRRENGFAWYPIAIKDTELGMGDYLVVELERTTHLDIAHNFRFGTRAALFSQHDPQADRVEGTISHISGNRMKISLRTDELPDWSRRGKLGIDAVFDENSYEEMENALRLAPQLSEKREEGKLVRILSGEQAPTFNDKHKPVEPSRLNEKQKEAVNRILAANELAIVHGPPGTGKTTTLVQAIRFILEQETSFADGSEGRRRVLVTAPSNAAVDLLSEKLSDEGLNVVRIGNPSRVNERQMALTLDSRMSLHQSMKDIKRLKKQASEYRDLAHKYKRNFGPGEREQRKALFTEARNISKEIERTEQYIVDDILNRAQVITSTLVGANHYTIRSLKFHTVVIDEAGQALEPSCWIPILKSKRLIMAGDHCQLPPTIKSDEAARAGLATTLMEKAVRIHPEAVVLLEEQYRMNEAIMGFSSREFYEGKLIAHTDVANRLLFEGDPPLVFIDTAGCGYEEVWEGTGISNPEEAALMLKHLAALIDELRLQFTPERFPSIGVISPYKHQVEALKEMVTASDSWKDLRINVNTIDSFQGQERDVVYISLTRSNADNVIGFLSEIRRMNVAMTRARKKLVVVGDSATLSGFPFYADFIEYAQKENGYVSAWELIS